VESKNVGVRKASLGQNTLTSQPQGQLKNAKHELGLSKNSKQQKNSSLGKHTMINTTDGSNQAATKKLGGLGYRAEHKRVKSDANDQNKVKLINGSMFVQAS
jgi:hypothetical protein